MFTTMWQRRSAFHHSNLAAEITTTNQPAGEFFKTLDGLHLDKAQQLDVVNEVVNHQAAVLGINDCFWIMGWTFVGLCLFLLLGRKKKVRYTPLA